MSTVIQPQSPHKMSVAEYLAFEEQSDVRHEYHRGEVFAMAGRTATHSQLKVALASLLLLQTRGRGCTVFDADMKVLIRDKGMYTYPDASVACGKPQYETEKQTTLLNPIAVFEVLSPSTEAYDRGEKFSSYLMIPSLRHYVLVSTSNQRIDLFTRDDNGEWRFDYAHQPGDVVDLNFIGCKLSLDELYAGIELEPGVAKPVRDEATSE